MSKTTQITLGNEIWEQYVPIIKETKKKKDRYNIYIQDQIESPDVYNELCYTLEHTKEGDDIRLHINTLGGYVDSAFKIRDVLMKCKGTTTAYLTGTVASAGTLIALSCDDLIVAGHLQFMIHNYSGGAQGKGHEMVAQVNFSNKEITKAFYKIYKHFLTKQEMIEVIKGDDIWLNATDVAKRWDIVLNKRSK